MADWVTAWDSFKNFVANLNIGRDKQTGGAHYLEPLTDIALSTIYRTSWMGRKVVDIPAKDATREWRDWFAEATEIEDIEALEKRLQIPQKVRRALQLARLYGGAGIYYSIKGQKPDQPLDLESVTQDSLQFVTVLSRKVLVAGDIILDPMLENYGKPANYTVTSGTGVSVTIDVSRLAIFIGSEVLAPDESTGEHKGWGDSSLQSAYEAVRNADATAANIASLVYEAKLDVLQIPGLAGIMSDDRTRNLLVQRVQLAAQLKGNNGMLIIDKEEEHSQKNFNFAGLTDINHQSLQAVSGAADVPITRFLGQSPTGLNNTGEADLKNYYDAVASLQYLTITPAITNLDEVLIRSALGSRPEDVYYEWASLWQMSDEQRSKISKETADTIKVLADTALFPEDALAMAASNMLIEHSNLPEMDFTEQDLIEHEEEKTEAEAAALALAKEEQEEEEDDDDL